MENKLDVTRIDFAAGGATITVNKIAETPDRAIVLDSHLKPADELDAMLTWCEQHGWTVRRYLPLGARAWKGEKARPVRNSAQIRRLRDELTARRVDGLQVCALDLAYDC